MRSLDKAWKVHPLGDGASEPEGYPAPHRIETFGGAMEVEWEERDSVSLHGPLAYFIEFLKESGLWKSFVDECPLRYSSPNAPSKEEILGTILLSVLSGHRRYAHITGMRSDGLLPQWLGIAKLRSEDSVRRAFEKQDEAELTLWMDRQMNATFDALLDTVWVLDLDATVKTLYGKQEEAKVGYNPFQKGRPSHVYHAMVLTKAQLVLNVDVQAGNQTASAYAQPGILGWLDSRPLSHQPWLVRGDIGYGTEEMITACEARELRYLFKLKRSKGVERLILALAKQKDKAGWRDAGQGWEAVSAGICLQGWRQERRVVVLRRLLANPPEADQDNGQARLPGLNLEWGGAWYEHAVLVTNWEETDLKTIAQMYRDRAATENLFDELKNQWGWTGFSTADLKRSQLMARIVALIFNWWKLYLRMAMGPENGEALTGRAQFQQAVARQTRHAGQNKLRLISMHGKGWKIAHLQQRVSKWLGRFREGAEQLGRQERWRVLLRKIFEELGGFQLIPRPRNAPPLAFQLPE
jgi:hypothetical protein